MSINNITRTNTIDEWRIQTNASGAELNKLETGTYTKTAGSLDVTGAANVRITASGVALTVANNALVGDTLTVSKDIALGVQSSQTGNIGVGNIINVYGQGNALIVANSALVNTNLQVTKTITTNNITVNSNVVVVGTSNIGYLGVSNTGVFGKSVSVGTTLDVTGNTTSGNLTTANATQTGTLRVDTTGTFGTAVAVGTTLDVTGNTTSGNLVTANATQTGTLRVTANTTSGNLTTANATQTGTLRVDTTGTFGTTLNVTGNTTSGNLTTANATQTGTLRVDTTINVGTTLDVTGNTTSGNLTTANATQTGTLRVGTSGTIGTTLDVTGNTTSGNLVTANATQTGTLRVGTTATVTGNVTAGNVNTSGMVYAGSIRSTGRGDFGAVTVTSLDTGAGDATVGGKLTVTGDFVLTGDIIYDTDILSISTVVPVTTTGAGYFGVFRGNTTGGVAGANVNTLGTVSDANAYIRWSASANNWQIRDIFNKDSTTSYSKILTANLITDSISTTSSSLMASATAVKTAYDAIDTANTKMRNYVDTANNTLVTFSRNLGATGPIVFTPTTTDYSKAGTLTHDVSGVGSVGTYQGGGADIVVPTFTVNTTGHVTAVANTTIRDASISAGGIKGVVALNDTSESTSTTTAATPNLVNRANTNIKNYVDTANTSLVTFSRNLGATSPIVFTPTTTDYSKAGTLSHATSGVTATTTNAYGSDIVVPTFYVNGTGHVTGAANVSIRAANTTVSGIVRLTDSTTTSDSTLAATATAVKSLADGKLSTFTISVPTGLQGSTTGSTATAGQYAITFQSGYSIPTDANQTNWNTAYADRNKWDGGSTGLTAGTGRSSLGATTLGSNLFTITNPSAITFPRFNADNSVSSLTASDFRSAIGALASVNATSPLTGSGTSGSALSIPAATASADGYMTSTYAGKLDGIAANANNYSPPQSIGTGNIVQFAGLWVGSGTNTAGTGEIITTGNITSGGSVTANSDRRLKTNIETITDALSKTTKLRGVTFDKDGIPNIGVIAQEVQEILPEVVVESGDEAKTLSVAYGNIVGLLIEAIKELKAEVDELKKNK